MTLRPARLAIHVFGIQGVLSIEPESGIGTGVIPLPFLAKVPNESPFGQFRLVLDSQRVGGFYPGLV